MIPITKSSDVNNLFNDIRANELKGKTNRELLEYLESLCEKENKTPDDYIRIGYLYGWVLVASVLADSGR